MSENVNPAPSGIRNGSPVCPAGSFGSGEFAESFQASYQTLWLVAVGVVGEPTMAEDVLQDAAIIAMGKLDQFSPGTNFNAWMGRIVRFVAMNHARKERKRRPVSSDTDASVRATLEPNDASSSKADRSDQASIDPRMVGALDQLGDVARSCLLLRTIADMPYVEIAKLLEIPEGTAMSHVHHTRRFLRGRLSEPPGHRPIERRGRA